MKGKESVPFYKGGICQGCLQVTALGDRTEILISCPDDGTGVYRGFLHGEKGSIALGILLPVEEEKRLTLHRMLLTVQLEEIGTLWRGEAVLSYAIATKRTLSGWEEETALESLFRDAVLASAAKKQKCAWVRREADKIFLAVPFWQKEFPLLPLFCFAQVQSLDGRLYAVFTLDGEGMPI